MGGMVNVILTRWLSSSGGSGVGTNQLPTAKTRSPFMLVNAAASLGWFKRRGASSMNSNVTLLSGFRMPSEREFSQSISIERRNEAAPLDWKSTLLDTSVDAP